MFNKNFLFSFNPFLFVITPLKILCLFRCLYLQILTAFCHDPLNYHLSKRQVFLEFNHSHILLSKSYSDTSLLDPLSTLLSFFLTSSGTKVSRIEYSTISACSFCFTLVKKAEDSKHYVGLWHHRDLWKKRGNPWHLEYEKHRGLNKGLNQMVSITDTRTTLCQVNCTIKQCQFQDCF